MHKSRRAKEQIIGMLREDESGVKAAELCRKYDILDAIFLRSRPCCAIGPGDDGDAKTD